MNFRASVAFKGMIENEGQPPIEVRVSPKARGWEQVAAQPALESLSLRERPHLLDAVSRAWLFLVLVLGLGFGVLSCARPAQAPTSDEERHDPPVTEEDVRILERADIILSSEPVWNRADTRECVDASAKLSLFCALQKASVEILGTYDHRRAALQEVRFVIEERGKEYEHRLMGFNNDPFTTFGDIKQVLRSAKKRVQNRLRH
ncbi:MAG TPA: hypothetical protein VM925_08300 [Labilithrix sp.]|nr:hypothetical protein [Labilithrix sp.]